jgi:hypothetical protein
MREPATKHTQGLVSEREYEALLAYQGVSITAKAQSSAVRELLAFALTRLGWLDDGSNGNITTLVAQNQKPKQTKAKHEKQRTQ